MNTNDNGNKIEINTKTGNSSKKDFLTHSKEGSNKGSITLQDIINIHKQKDKK